MRTVRKRSQKQEKKVAEQFNGRQVIASGSLWFADSDVRTDKFLIECKTTEKEYYSLTSKVWEKIEKEAIKDRMRIPLMAIDLQDKHRVIVFRLRDFESFDYEVTMKDIPKSMRITVDDYGNRRGIFLICGTKVNVLCYMKVEDFIEVYKEEL